ncbi:MAG: hypothetical protein AB8G22_05450 [Saprospiraceae bacterium]
MDNLVVNNYLSIIERLDLETRLMLLSALTENIRVSVKKTNTSKLELLHRLYGSWSDVDESIIEDIYSHRSIPARDITFD